MSSPHRPLSNFHGGTLLAFLFCKERWHFPSLTHNRHNSVFSLSLTGLIDYNFHCFKNAIQEVFDVRVKVQQNRKLLSQRRWSKLTMTNGVLSNLHWGLMTSHQSAKCTLTNPGDAILIQRNTLSFFIYRVSFILFSPRWIWRKGIGRFTDCILLALCSRWGSSAEYENRKLIAHLGVFINHCWYH